MWAIDELPFFWDHIKKCDFWLDVDKLGWNVYDRNGSIATFGKDDPLYFYMRQGIDVGFFYGGYKYWIESPCEDFRNHGGDVWSLAICDTPNPEWSGEYMHDRYMGLRRHDADERRELCFYDGIEEFLRNVKIDGKDIRDVLEESFITDL